MVKNQSGLLSKSKIRLPSLLGTLGLERLPKPTQIITIDEWPSGKGIECSQPRQLVEVEASSRMADDMDIKLEPWLAIR
jgi:hypothetical protein